MSPFRDENSRIASLAPQRHASLQQSHPYNPNARPPPPLRHSSAHAYHTQSFIGPAKKYAGTNTTAASATAAGATECATAPATAATAAATAADTAAIAAAAADTRNFIRQYMVAANRPQCPVPAPLLPAVTGPRSAHPPNSLLRVHPPSLLAAAGASPGAPHPVASYWPGQSYSSPCTK